jgi:hypothetical protein
MQKALRPCALVPPGFVVESAACDSVTTLIFIHLESRKVEIAGITCGAQIPVRGRSVGFIALTSRRRGALAGKMAAGGVRCCGCWS